MAQLNHGAHFLPLKATHIATNQRCRELRCSHQESRNGANHRHNASASETALGSHTLSPHPHGRRQWPRPLPFPLLQESLAGDPKADTAFLNDASLAAVTAQERLADLVNAVQSVRLLFVASQNVSNSEFQLFIAGVFETAPAVSHIS